MHLSSALGSVMDVPVVAATRLKGRISLQDNYFLLDFFKIRLKELIQLIPRNHIFRLTLAFQLGIASIVEVAMAGIGYDEKFLVLRHWIRLADCIISSGLTLYHILVSSLAEVTGMGFLSVHDEHRRTYLVDIMEEARIGICLTTEGVPAIVAPFCRSMR